MIVPSYVPPPIEIPHNVAVEPVELRLGFVRRVSTLSMASVAVIASVAKALPGTVPLASSVAASLAILVALCAVRGLAKGRRMEVVVSQGMMAPLLISLGLAMGGLQAMGWTLWPFAATLAMAWLYAVFAGRDMSFVAMFFLPFVGSTGLWIAAVVLGWAPKWELPWALIANTALLFYWVYDLAALLTRRRLGEEMGALADLYRDVLNFTTYWIRVINHWRRYRLWAK